MFTQREYTEFLEFMDIFNTNGLQRDRFDTMESDTLLVNFDASFFRGRLQLDQ